MNSVSTTAAVESQSGLGPLGDEILAINAANGWNVATPNTWTDDNAYRIPAILALIHSEIDEALAGWASQDRENFAEELADTQIRILDLLHGLGTDLDAELRGICGAAVSVGVDCLGRAYAARRDLARERACGYTQVLPIDWSRVGQTIPADLSAIGSQVSQALESFRKHDRKGFDRSLAYAFAWVCDLAEGLGVDLAAAIAAKLKKNRTRGHRHGGKRV